MTPSQARAQNSELALEQAEGRQPVTASIAIRNNAPVIGIAWITPPLRSRNRSVFKCCWTFPAQKNSSGL